jgi:hypothetical protein
LVRAAQAALAVLRVIAVKTVLPVQLLPLVALSVLSLPQVAPVVLVVMATGLLQALLVAEAEEVLLVEVLELMASLAAQVEMAGLHRTVLAVQADVALPVIAKHTSVHQVITALVTVQVVAAVVACMSIHRPTVAVKAVTVQMAI